MILQLNRKCAPCTGFSNGNSKAMIDFIEFDVTRFDFTSNLKLSHNCMHESFEMFENTKKNCYDRHVTVFFFAFGRYLCLLIKKKRLA